MLPRVSRFSKTKNPISSKEKTISLVLAISHIQYFTFYTPKSKSNDLWSVLRSSVLNQKICEPAPRFQSKLNDSWSALRRSNLNQRFANHHFRSGFGMQIMNHLIWIWTMEQVCESFDPNTLRIPNLNQKIRKPTSRFQSKSNDLCSALRTLDIVSWTIISDQDSECISWIFQFVKWFVNLLRSSDLNQMIHDTPFDVPIWIKWSAIHDEIGALRNSESFCDAMF